MLHCHFYTGVPQTLDIPLVMIYKKRSKTRNRIHNLLFVTEFVEQYYVLSYRYVVIRVPKSSMYFLIHICLSLIHI